MASLHEENRYLKAVAAIVGTADPHAWVSVAAVSAHVAEATNWGNPDERTEHALRALSEDDIVLLSDDGTQVCLTPWGRLMLA
jgi:hypothetical protein